MKDNREKTQLIDENKNLILISIGVVGFISALWFLTFYILKDRLPEDRGTFGDMFGGINALFTGLAFGGIIITILLQRKDLALQQEELRDTRNELKRTADAQNTQNSNLLSQQYQTTFFNLLSNHTSLVNSIPFTPNGGIGFEGLAMFNQMVQNNAQKYAYSIKHHRFESAKETVNNPLYLLEKNQHFFDSLFGDLKTIVDIINGLLKDNLYYDILFNHLTPSEKYLIGLYCDCIGDEHSRWASLHPYNFSRYYQKQYYHTYSLTPKTYFPAISIERTKIKNQFFESEITPESDIFSFHINIIRDHIGKVLVLKRVNFKALDNAAYNKPVSIFEQAIEDNDLLEMAIMNSPKIYLMPHVYEKLFKNLRAFMILHFDFVFQYNDIEYLVRYRVDISMQLGVNYNKDGKNENVLSFSYDS